ncbi:MAG: SDR family oxidoreductase, partial [Microthrixaceae bacterium]
GITGSIVPDDEFELKSWRTLLDVNLNGVFLGCRATIPHMISAGGGSVVNIASVAALNAVPGAAFGYQASKAAVRMLTKSLAVRYGPHGVRVNSVHPGFMPPMSGGSAPQPERADLVPMRRIGEVTDIASAVLHLVSPASRYVTGSDLVVDGGLSSQIPMPR